MKAMKYTKLEAWSESVSGAAATILNPKGWRLTRAHYKATLVILAAFMIFIFLLHRESITESTSSLVEELSRAVSWKAEPTWNYSSHRFQPSFSDWDEKRSAWLEDHQVSKPEVWVVTDSFPQRRDPPVSSHILLKAAKNKLDYTRLHRLRFYYSVNDIDSEFTDWWTKLPLIRMLMLRHPEAEWIWWMDADSIITDMSFVPPFEELNDYNLALNGAENLVYRRPERKGVSTANFFIRNCQWSLDLIDAWASMGKTDIREESAVFQSEVISSRSVEIPGDDQSGIVALLAQDNKKKKSLRSWTSKVKLVGKSDYDLNADWRVVAPLLENLTVNPAWGDSKGRAPFVTHFAGCIPGTPEHALSIQSWDKCLTELDRTFDFADNQVYDRYGFVPRKLGHSDKPLLEKDPSARIRQEAEFANGTEYYLAPKILDWDERRRKWIEAHPYETKDDVILISGSSPRPCENPIGSHLITRSFKNKLDFARMHDIPFLYNMALVHKNLTGWWSKIPVLRMMMLNNPGVEWFWWADSDAIVTDMYLKFPFARYQQTGHNMVLWGDYRDVYENKNYAGINAGDYLVRNCQWTLDLFDRWASFAATRELRWKYDKILSDAIARSPGWEADDQSVLVYLLTQEPERWSEKVLFESEFHFSAEWSYATAIMDYVAPQDRSFVTHFAGCQPCNLNEYRDCLTQLNRALNFADNQLMENYGLRHQNLSSWELVRNYWTDAKIEDVKEQEEQAHEELEAKEEAKEDAKEKAEEP